MSENLLLSFRLRNTYKTNSIIWSLRGLPFVKKIVTNSLYADRDVKITANILCAIWEFFSAFLGKALYLLLVFTQTMSMQVPSADSYVHMLLLLTIVGGIANTQIFNPTKDKFYAIFLMRMDARGYTLVNYLYFLLKMLVGFAAFSLLFGRLAKASVLTCLLVPVYVISIKLICTAITLVSCKKQSRTHNENKLNPVLWVLVGVLSLAAILPPYLGYAISEQIFQVIVLLCLIPGGFAFYYIWKFDSYRSIYKELLQPENFKTGRSKTATGAAQQLALQKKITADTSITSNKTGYRYFNELFMKRHTRLMTSSAKRITLISFLLLVAAMIALAVFPEAKPDINKVMLNYLPYFLFIMYILNRGKFITQAMFMNCDHSMLAYRFYRQPKAILFLFTDRLKYMVLINLMPAFVIACALPLILYVTGGTDEPLNYVLLFVSILAMSVFFSVHNLVLYYLLQPYNVNLESKSAAYQVLHWITYMICYAGIQVRLSTLLFGTAITIFCIVYVMIALLLAYRLAPKTFKLRS